MEECYLRIEKEFWTARGRKTIFPIGTKFIYEMETMSSVVGGEIRRYFVYGCTGIVSGVPDSEMKPKVHVGHYEEDEFQESFMTKEEFRDKKIDEII